MEDWDIYHWYMMGITPEELSRGTPRSIEEINAIIEAEEQRPTIFDLIDEELERAESAEE